MNDDCVFCKIVTGAIPAKFVHQEDELVAIEDIHPQAPTHLLADPRNATSPRCST